MTDYRRFLGRNEERVLAHLGGAVVAAGDRSLTLPAPVPAGWWRVSVSGRKARALERVDPPAEVLAALPAVAGHWSGALLVHGASAVERLHLVPEDELPRFAPVRARRWHSGDLVFEVVDLEGEEVEIARRRFEEDAPLSGARGIPGTLRAAFALALLAAASSRARVPFSPLEVRRDLSEVAERGVAAAVDVLHRLQGERERAALVLPRPARPAVAVAAPVEDVVGRAAAALRGSGAELLDARRLGDGLLVVTWRFLHERLVAVVDPETLRVVDAGICLSGHDEELTLASLPGVVREGVEQGVLVITNHG